MFAPVNLLALGVGIISYMAIGMLWYSSILFANYCPMSTRKDNVKPSGKEFAAAMVIAIISSWSIAQIIGWTNPPTLMMALTIGFVSWLGLMAAPCYSQVIWAGQDVITYGVNVSGGLVRILVLSALFFLWQ